MRPSNRRERCCVDMLMPYHYDINMEFHLLSAEQSHSDFTEIRGTNRHSAEKGYGAKYDHVNV